MQRDTISNLVSPIVIDLILYKNDYFDRILISYIKEQTDMIRLDENSQSFYIATDDILDLIAANYREEYDNITKGVTEINSVNFILTLCMVFPKIKYFCVNISNNKPVRKQGDEDFYDFKLIHCHVNLSGFLEASFLNRIIEVFEKTRLYTRNLFFEKPYIDLYYGELLSILRNYQINFDFESEDYLFIEDIINIFGTKLEKDNPLLCIVIAP